VIKCGKENVKRMEVIAAVLLLIQFFCDIMPRDVQYAWFVLVQGLAVQRNCWTFKMERVVSFDLKRMLHFPPLALQQTEFNICDKLA
jgi:hypothetical protein